MTFDVVGFFRAENFGHLVSFSTYSVLIKESYLMMMLELQTFLQKIKAALAGPKVFRKVRKVEI